MYGDEVIERYSQGIDVVFNLFKSQGEKIDQRDYSGQN